MVVHNLFKKLNNLSINVQDRKALHYEPLRNLITGKHFSSTGKILSMVTLASSVSAVFLGS